MIVAFAFGERENKREFFFVFLSMCIHVWTPTNKRRQQQCSPSCCAPCNPLSLPLLSAVCVCVCAFLSTVTRASHCHKNKALTNFFPPASFSAVCKKHKKCHHRYRTRPSSCLRPARTPSPPHSPCPNEPRSAPHVRLPLNQNPLHFSHCYKPSQNTPL